MELDAQVEEPLQVIGTNPEHKHKHKKKDKHKHKHHKKSKRDRHGNAEQDPPQEGELIRTGSEDGELPRPPAVEAPVATPGDHEVEPIHELEQAQDFFLDRPSAKRRYARNAEILQLLFQMLARW